MVFVSYLLVAIQKSPANYLFTKLYPLIFAPQVGLEPTTYGLTVRRSNQLSY
jgi:hypothetical protein